MALRINSTLSLYRIKEASKIFNRANEFRPQCLYFGKSKVDGTQLVSRENL